MFAMPLDNAFGTGKMRVILCTFFLCLYYSLYFYYVWEWTHQDFFNVPECRLFWQCITGGLLTFAFIDWKVGIVYYTHKQLNGICFLSVIFNFLINILAMSFIIKHPELLFYLFNGLCFVVTVWILIQAKKYEMLND